MTQCNQTIKFIVFFVVVVVVVANLRENMHAYSMSQLLVYDAWKQIGSQRAFFQPHKEIGYFRVYFIRVCCHSNELCEPYNISMSIYI
jgi:hypothetical protein